MVLSECKTEKRNSWSQPLLVAHTKLFEISCRGSYVVGIIISGPGLNAINHFISILGPYKKHF